MIVQAGADKVIRQIEILHFVQDKF
jgi:hypothetical protein